ncbi:hypothetical protein HETIRDRAFT_31970 [Heterobasidion irregulare TC 32-1]|uniref:Protein kinase domain-containing protein n=1 Tax=Heterobasidion irregulare (strain TC 32-1) TaxID=747525 RepID=W4KM33_HETIT|nr:uncharacterized protein HETIRDRAFT_31970 [Heterobasidion irregulare TC 32-1]ETW86121.1 hypothetical protein HETIRDRAFT_31970 [Heterobasidion irregulare TC 32-1]
MTIPGDESELTELSESEAETVTMTVSPSPRRLRSQGERAPSQHHRQSRESCDEQVRTTPKRKVKEKLSDMQEELTEEEGEVEDEDEEVDELMSSKSPTPPPPPLRTPVRHRLRPRQVQTYTPPSDGDDEEEAEEDQGEGEEVGSDEDEEGDGEEETEAGDVEEAEEEVDEIEEEEEDDEEDDATLVEPRKLRNGKIVGEEDIPEDSEDAEAESVEEMSIDEDIDLEAEDTESESESNASNDSEFVDEAMDVDLTIATAKSLVRLRRDDLVRLCEHRDLDVEGTKPELAEALLLWRDRQTEASSPSSTGTVRPPSTTRPRANGRRKRSNGDRQTTPVLLRSEHVHQDEPRTPPMSNSGQKEEELELDLEAMGLEDREIPPAKLTKLDKIGSGGFKDVFIGKFKGRKVAIAELREKLSEMDIKELKLLGGFNHPNIVRFLGVSIPEDTRVTPVMIVSELCANGDLFDYVRNVPPPSLYRILSIMLDIARGLEYLHLRKPSVIHRDCKSSNILITSKGIAKIADFGLAKVKQSTRSMVRSLVGTVNWQAPELWHAHPKYNHKVDVYACGMVFWEMLQWHLPNKKFPWEGMNEHAIYEAVGAKHQRPSLAGLRKQYCPEIVQLVEHMWAQDHQDRPTMSEVVERLEELVQEYR